MSEKTQKTDISKVMPKEKAAMKDQPKKERISSPPGSEEKARAVLSLWSGRRRPAEVCREYGVKYTLLSHWERRALEALMGALTNEEPGRPEEILLADPEKDRLEQQVKTLEKELETAKQSDFVRKVLADYEERIREKQARKKNGR